MKDDSSGNLFYNADITISYINAVYKFSNKREKWNYNPKWNYHKLMYILDGEVEMTIFGEKYTAKKDNVVFVPKNCSFHSKGIKGHFKYISLQFDVSKDIKYPFRYVYDLKDSAYFYTCFCNILNEWNKRGPGYIIYIKRDIYNILGRLLYEETKNSESLEEYRKIEKSVIYMSENFFDPDLSVEKIAKEAFLSETTFRIYFKKIYHSSPRKYINNVRIEKAKELLRNSIYPIDEISRIVGFSNVCYFDRIFKNETGLTPGEYRKK